MNWEGEHLESAALEEAFSRLHQMPTWPSVFGASREDFARLKNFTSSAIGRFAQAVTVVDRGVGTDIPGRYRFRLHVPPETQAEIAVLKSVVATAVMRHETRRPIYQHQRDVLVALLDVLVATGSEHLDPMYQADFHAASLRAGPCPRGRGPGCVTDRPIGACLARATDRVAGDSRAVWWVAELDWARGWSHPAFRY